MRSTANTDRARSRGCPPMCWRSARIGQQALERIAERARRRRVERRSRSRRGRFTHATPVPRSVLTTGLPRAIASICTTPNASCRVTDGSTNRSHARYSAASSSSVTSPTNLTRSAMPSCVRPALRALPLSGPSPTRTAMARGLAQRFEQDVDALVGDEPPDEQHERPADLAPNLVGARGSRRALGRPVSTPNGMTTHLACHSRSCGRRLRQRVRRHDDARGARQREAQERAIEQPVAPARADDVAVKPDDELSLRVAQESRRPAPSGWARAAR